MTQIYRPGRRGDFRKSRQPGTLGQPHISDTLLTSLKDKRHETASQLEATSRCIDPVIFVEKWQREGFDIMQPGVTYKIVAD